jgi:hypothetical protein
MAEGLRPSRLSCVGCGSGRGSRRAAPASPPPSVPAALWGSHPVTTSQHSSTTLYHFHDHNYLFLKWLFCRSGDRVCPHLRRPRRPAAAPAPAAP